VLSFRQMFRQRSQFVHSGGELGRKWEVRMFTLLLVVALVVLLIMLGRESDRSQRTRVVEIVDWDDDEQVGTSNSRDYRG
jgi:hypothetical protein